MEYRRTPDSRNLTIGMIEAICIDFRDFGLLGKYYALFGQAIATVCINLEAHQQLLLQATRRSHQDNYKM
jgi:hypothetical protein